MKSILIIVAFVAVILIANFIHSDRNLALRCDDFNDPSIWTTKEGSSEIILHYMIEEVPNPSTDKFVRIFWGDGSSERRSIGLGSSISGEIGHKYSVRGDKKIEVFFSIAGSDTECGLHTFVSI